jgi:hypothetical protein
MKISSTSGIDSVDFTVTLKRVTAVNYIKGRIYCDCRGKICNFLKCSVQESPLPVFVIILITLFCSLNIFLLIEEFTQNITT